MGGKHRGTTISDMNEIVSNDMCFAQSSAPREQGASGADVMPTRAPEVRGTVDGSGGFVGAGSSPAASTLTRRIGVFWDRSTDGDPTDALSQVVASLNALLRDGELNLCTVLTCASEARKQVASSDELDHALLRAMIHAALCYLISESDMNVAYPNALRILYRGVRLDENESVSSLRAAACACVKQYARIGVHESKEKVQALAGELAAKFPLQQVVKDLERIAGGGNSDANDSEAGDMNVARTPMAKAAKIGKEVVHKDKDTRSHSSKAGEGKHSAGSFTTPSGARRRPRRQAARSARSLIRGSDSKDVNMFWSKFGTRTSAQQNPARGRVERPSRASRGKRASIHSAVEFDDTQHTQAKGKSNTSRASRSSRAWSSKDSK